MTRAPAPIRHISPDDLDDAEWDRLVNLPTPAALAPRIGLHVADMSEIIWRVDAARPTEQGFAIYLGRPVSMSGPGGAAVIITDELRDYLERHRRSPELIDLPVGRTVIKRLRRALGHNWYEDGERWWLDRMDDLETLTTADFAVRHNIKLAAVTYARLNLLGSRQRPAHWWRDPAAADLILSPQPRLYVAQMLDICASAVGVYRTRLRREAGEPMDRDAVNARIAAAKRSRPAHPATKAALREAASRPKSEAWRAGHSERMRERERPASWVEREWTSAQDALLGSMPDRAAAAAVGRTIGAVRSRRQQLGRAAYRPPSEPTP